MPTMFYKSDQLGIPFLVYPGESLEIIKDDRYFKAVIPGNPIRTNELRLLRELVLKKGPLIGSGSLESQAHKSTKGETRKFEVSLFIDLYFKRLAIVDSFRMHNVISDVFERYIRNYLYYNLLDHSINFLIRSTGLISKYEGLARLIEDADLASQDSSLISIDRYRAFLISYNIYLSNLSGNGSGYLSQAENASLRFSGRASDYLLFIITKTALFKGDVSANSIMQLFYSNCKTLEYTRIIREQEALSGLEYYNGVNEFAEKDTATINFLAVLKRTNAKLIYIDIWASWCIPCMEEIPFSKKLQETFPDNGEIAFVYISVDSSNILWQKGIKQMMKFIKPNHSYRLDNTFNSRFARSLSIVNIPRYLIVDSNGKILNADAPRPSDPTIYKELSAYLKAIN